ncbi:putative mitochondrial hypothetical protein [Leptomonas pyrrhocoris]|uniref:Uncharacterized protein n=1 Tax=Leptomonas pyrrhocoris TaxID=157538 RepID=A0A0M9G6V5_LEPPY|nr:putative mitochondrial hypothetical protein [Leptomonas pyrrhocoris]KPA83677.1 putative mitochondrial hypothetical protein [Leptomonas pyrrhocoris]|eukprot:XP_015662116.1 putative mitochondrial hypothetical protein [Leptomonas pyrrhocoris]
MSAAVRTPLTNFLSADVARAASAPLCMSVRRASEAASAGAPPSTHLTEGSSDQEEVLTSFGADGAPSAAQRSHGGSHGAHRRPPQQQRHTSSTQFSNRGADSDRHQRHDGTSAAPVSRAVLAARLMRRHRLHTTQPYLVLSSGEEVPGCSGGVYHLQGRLDARAAAGGARSSAYAGRVRGGGNSVRMASFPYRDGSPAAFTAAAAAASPQVCGHDAAYRRMQDFEPFERLFRRYLERGHVLYATQRLLHHPNAPAPVVLLDRILRHRVPAPAFVSQALLSSMHGARTDRSTSAAATFALQRVTARLRTDATCRPLYDTPDIRALLLEATLREGLFDVATELVQETPNEWITPHAWSLLVQAAGQAKLPHSQLLWRLLSIRDGSSSSSPAEAAEAARMPSSTGSSSSSSSNSSSSGPMQRVLTRAGESALLKRVPLCGLPYPMSAGAPPAPPPLPPPSFPTASAAAAAAVAASQGTESAQRGEASLASPFSASSAPLAASPSASRSPAPSSRLPLDAVHIPGFAFAARTCGTVQMPTFPSIGAPLFQSNARLSERNTSANGEEAAAEKDSARSAAPALPPPPSSATSALVPSTFSTEGMRWCALGPVDMGYAAEHYNSDTAAAAGDFRAVGAAGALFGFSSFQSLFAEVEEEVRRTASTEGAPSSSSLPPRASRRVLWETTALRMLHQQHGIVYGLDATTTARVLLRCGVGFSGQASPLLAQHVLRRYLRSCHVLRDEVVRAQELIEAQMDAEEEEAVLGRRDRTPRSTIPLQNASETAAAAATEASAATTTTAVTTVSPRRSAKELLELYPRLSRAVAPHPSPFLVFFKVMREAREVLSNAVDEEVAAAAAARRSRTSGLRANSSLPMVHWELVWHAFQQLNRENPLWFTQMTAQEAGDLCQDVIEVLCHGADPWLPLNVARRVSLRHVVDGVEMALWLLHRLDPSHHTEEAREVARKLFRWLLVDVGLHLQPSLHHHLIPAARALIRLGLQEELRVLYSAVLDNVYVFLPEHRDAFIHVLRDLICPSCASILPESDVYVDRACPNCMAVVPAKDADTIPSFRLSAEHVERLRERRKQQRQRTRQRLSASVHRLQSEDHDRERRPARPQRPYHLRGPQDAADVLRRHLQRSKEAEEEEGNEDGGNVMALRLAEAATLVPGVSVGSDYALFPVAGGGDSGHAAVMDVRAAMEESSRRLELQRAARRYALAQRGDTSDDAQREASFRDRNSSSSSGLVSPYRTSAAMPTTLPISAQELDAATLKYLSTAANAGARASAATNAAHDGVWVCVWCQAENTEWSSRVQCSACGAETGPAAPWRHFAYADPVTGDVMAELRGRMSNCEERPVDAIVAGYLLMVYRRTFQLRATPADQERLQRLVAMLCRLQERVLAGYVYTRLVPLPQRHVGALLHLLAQTYGQESEARYRALTQDDLTRPEKEGVFFEAVFGPQTCRVCFGSHDWHLCPIVTRDFAGAADAQHEQQRSPISLSPEEKQRAVLERLAQRIHEAAQSAVAATAPAATSPTASSSTARNPAAAAGKPNAQLVVNAYVAFVSSPFREIFAELHADDTNELSLLLSSLQQYRRAAFVLCHIPLTQRSTAAYLRLVSFFNVTEEEALTLLDAKTKAPHPSDPTAASATSATAAAAPNFVQVTKTCCMCLDQRHASHECPRLGEWLRGVQRLAREERESAAAAAAAAAKSSTSTTTALVDSVGSARLRQRLRAQVDGWTTAGPERLHAFYRYLVAHMELLGPSSRDRPSAASPSLASSSTATAAAAASSSPRRMDLNDPLVYAVNKTVTKLAMLERRSETYRLYAHAPVECVSAATTSAVLRMNGFAEDSIRALLKADDYDDAAASSSMDDDSMRATEAELMMARSGSNVHAVSAARQRAPLAARTAAVPVQRCCLLCFSSAHAYVDCPELAAAATEAEKLLLVVQQVGGISCVHDGIGAAAAYVYNVYNRGRLSGGMVRLNPALVTALLTLARRCFATHQLSHGMRVLRRIPVEMVPPATAYTDLWRAAGLPEESVEQKQAQLLALYDAEGLVPSVDSPPPRPTFSNSFLSQLSRVLHDDVCRHCYEHGHTIATCPLFHAEVSFGRDYVAAYRMSMMSEQLDRAWQEAYLLKLVDFFRTHYLFMPYHIAGVANALNAITAMWSFRGEPGIALRNLLMIPPAYRRRQAFKHVLHALRVPSADITRLLGDFYFAPENSGVGGGGNGSGHNSAGGGNPQQQQEMMMAQHLLIPKPAIRDLARRQIFEQVPAAMVALTESTERMAHIRANHERRGGAADTLSSSSSASAASEMNAGSGMGVGISARIAQSIRQQQQQQQQPSPDMDGVSASSFNSPILRRVMQSGDMAQLREDFDPILAELENAVGMRLGSRHTLFTSAIDIVGSAAASTATSGTAGAARRTRAPSPTHPSRDTSSPSSSSSFSAEVSTSSTGRGVSEAEVVTEVQTQPVQRGNPQRSATPRSSSFPLPPKPLSAAQEPPFSSFARQLREQQQGQPPPRSPRGTQPVNETSVTAPQVGDTATTGGERAPANSGAVPHAASRMSEDEVKSSFSEPSTRTSRERQRQQQQQQQRSQGPTDHRSRSNNRDYRGNRSNAQPYRGSNRRQTQQQSQRRHDRRDGRGSNTEAQ